MESWGVPARILCSSLSLVEAEDDGLLPGFSTSFTSVKTEEGGGGVGDSARMVETSYRHL